MNQPADHQPVIVSGSIAIDRLMTFSGTYADLLRPDKLDSLSISVFLDKLTDARGGVGANIAYSLALLGEHPVLLGAVGGNAADYIEHLHVTGVDTSYVFTSELPTASFSVITDQDQNQVGGFYPGAMFDSDSLDLAPWQDKKPLVLVGAHDPNAMKRQVNQCKEFGFELCYDIGQQVSNMLIEDMIEGVEAAHILIANEYEMALLSEKIGRSATAIKQQVPIVITTLGKHGSRLEGSSLSKPIEVGVAKPTSETDPTGAGDAYRAGFLYGYVRHWDLQQCARLGAVTSSFVLEYNGPQNHSFNLDDVAQRYQTTFDEQLPVA